MSFIYSQALEAAFSAVNCLDTGQSVQLNGSFTPRLSLSHDKTMEPSRLSRFGMTCKPLTESRGAELLTWCVEDSRARTSALPEKVQESPGRDQECGLTWRGSLAKYDPDSCSWKTAQCLLLGGLEEFSETWPRWGLMRNGECWEVTTLEPRIAENEFGYLPTPKKQDSRHASSRHLKQGDSHWESNLGEVFVAATNCKRMPSSFVAVLMGWPTTHTKLQPLETGKYQQWLRQHGAYSEADK